MLDQTIRLAPKAVSYTVVCEACAAEHGFLGAQVEGRLDLEREHTTLTCMRGHELRVERAKYASIGVPSA